jgi:NADPH:quinone reductase-like Zn-dependent oxidoreductase
MKRILFDSFGDPAEVLYLAEAEEQPPGPGEVLLQILLRPINPADIAFIKGSYVPSETWPACPGMEAVGRVTATGTDVADVRIGGRYIISRIRGTWSESMRVPADALIPVADDTPDAVACQLSINPLTALLMLQCVSAQGVLVQTAAGSAVGRLVNQLAQKQGRKVINLVRRQDTADDLLAAGYPHVVVMSEPGWQDRVRETAGYEPVVAAFDPVAGSTGQELLGVLSRGGELILYGSLSGAPVPASAMQLAANDLSIRGFWLAPWFTQAGAEEKTGMFHTLEEMFRNGELSIPVAGIHDLADIRNAVSRVQAPGRLGKILLRN